MKIQFNTSALAGLVVLGVLFSSCSGDNHEAVVNTSTPVSVTVANAASGPANTIRVSGQVNAKETAFISTRIMGFITSIKVKEGDNVQKGQLLATISNADIEAKKAQAQAMLSEAEAALTDAQKDYERFTELHRQNSASTKELENVTLHFNSIKAKTEAARQMKREAEAMLAYTNLTAPFSGVITQRNNDAGSMANPGAPILVLEQSGNYEVTASVSESEIARVREGAAAEVWIKSTGKIVKGNISEVSPSARFSGGQYMIKVNIASTEAAGLYPGMYAQVTIQAGDKAATTNAILVPQSAIHYKDQLAGLYTITDSKTALLRWVRLGKSEGNLVEILSGLSRDEKFILESEGKLYNGVPVAIK